MPWCLCCCAVVTNLSHACLIDACGHRRPTGRPGRWTDASSRGHASSGAVRVRVSRHGRDSWEQQASNACVWSFLYVAVDVFAGPRVCGVCPVNREGHLLVCAFPSSCIYCTYSCSLQETGKYNGSIHPSISSRSAGISSRNAAPLVVTDVRTDTHRWIFIALWSRAVSRQLRVRLSLLPPFQVLNFLKYIHHTCSFHI